MNINLLYAIGKNILLIFTNMLIVFSFTLRTIENNNHGNKKWVFWNTLYPLDNISKPYIFANSLKWQTP